CQHYNDFLPTF
nr:immunoglobulin light chain junction region [Macaca mulatta]MOX48239.1 immunoglobulin light chain junction region [Macaca mulatta]MOX48520.1 immunoglobulin light chain junction region [Macaca mulatta]MOX48983.1 immunoglobulin light chain junction region [Macaca mulatta]MOX50006.1 immunoglobulin light chain junction region [Macaca mulatta]